MYNSRAHHPQRTHVRVPQKGGALRPLPSGRGSRGLLALEGCFHLGSQGPVLLQLSSVEDSGVLSLKFSDKTRDQMFSLLGLSSLGGSDIWWDSKLTEKWLSTRGGLAPGDIFHCLETFLVISTRRMLLVCRGYRPGVPRKVLQCTGQAPTARKALAHSGHSSKVEKPCCSNPVNLKVSG